MTFEYNEEVLDLLLKKTLGSSYTSSKLVSGQEHSGIGHIFNNQIFSSPITDFHKNNFTWSTPTNVTGGGTVSELTNVTGETYPTEFTYIKKYENIPLSVVPGTHYRAWKPTDDNMKEKFKNSIIGKSNFVFTIETNITNYEILLNTNSSFKPIINSGVLLFIGNITPDENSTITFKELYIYEGQFGLVNKLNMGDLEDVDLYDAIKAPSGAQPNNDDVLIYDAVNNIWIPDNIVSKMTLNDIPDVDTTGKLDGDLLSYDASSNKFITQPAAVPMISNLADVNISNIGESNIWNLETTLKADDASINDNFGEILSATNSLSFLAIGAPNKDNSIDELNTGGVYIFNSSRDQHQLFIPPQLPFFQKHEGDIRFGTSVDIKDNYLIIGAPQDNYLDETNVNIVKGGVVYSYKFSAANNKYGGFTEPDYTFDVSTYTGTGISGDVDDLLAQSKLNNPKGLAIDNNENIYVADYANNKIRKLDNAQTTTLATGLAQPYGIIYDPLEVNNYSQIDVISTKIADGFSSPNSISKIGNDSYVADTNNNKIVKLTKSSDLILSFDNIIETKIVASDAATDDFFGRSVAISGNYAIVGAYLNDDAGSDSGSAYIFNVATGAELHKLTASDAAAGDNFGIGVAISGNYAIVGAYQDDDAPNNSGSAYIFNIITGAQLHKLTASDAADSDYFGHSVGISGNYAIVGASGNDDDDVSSGSAYIFSFDDTTATELHKLTASDAYTTDYFGHSVAIDGNYAIVGAQNDDDDGSASGSAYIFNVTTGAELHKLTASDAAASDNFGIGVAISGNYAIVGAYDNDDHGSNSGSAYIFSFNDTTATELHKIVASDAAANDIFGRSVAISGNYAIVGAPGNDDGGSGSGSAYIFNVTTGAELKKITASDADTNDGFSHGAVAIDGNYAIVGAYGDDNNGSTYIYKMNTTLTTNFTQSDYITGLNKPTSIVYNPTIQDTHINSDFVSTTLISNATNPTDVKKINNDFYVLSKTDNTLVKIDSTGNKVSIIESTAKYINDYSLSSPESLQSNITPLTVSDIESTVSTNLEFTGDVLDIEKVGNDIYLLYSDKVVKNTGTTVGSVTTYTSADYITGLNNAKSLIYDSQALTIYNNTFLELKTIVSNLNQIGKIMKYNDKYYGVDTGNNTLLKITSNNNVYTSSSFIQNLKVPTTFTIHNDEIYIFNSLSKKIVKYDINGVFIEIVIALTYNITDIIFDSQNDIIVSQEDTNIVRILQHSIQNIHTTQSGSWTQLGADIDGEAAGDESGYSVSMNSDGTIVAIGAMKNTPPPQYVLTAVANTVSSNNATSRIYFYTMQNVEIGYVAATGANGTDMSARIALLINNTADIITAGITASSEGATLTISKPDAFKYKINGEMAINYPAGSWQENATNITVDADTIYTTSGGTGDNAGHVRVYQWNGTDTWTQLGEDIDGEAAGDKSGLSVSLSGDGTIVAIGATNNDGTGGNAGHVRVYHYANSIWNKLGQDIDGEAAGNNSGGSVSLNSDGTFVAIGATYNDGITGTGSNAGHVRVYHYANSIWNKLGQDIDGEAAGDNSGYSVSLSSDGTIVAIGARKNDGNGEDSGHVRVYQYDNNVLSNPWQQLGSDIDGEAAGDYSGYSVSLSSDGTILAIGAIYNDGNGSDSGHVRVFQHNNSDFPGIIDTQAKFQAINTGDKIYMYLANGTLVAEMTVSGNNSVGLALPYSQGGQTVIEWPAADHLTFNTNLRLSVEHAGGTWPTGLTNSGGWKVYTNDNGLGGGEVGWYLRTQPNVIGGWTQLGSDIDGEAAEDLSGLSVSLSGDGTIVAIGAKYHDSPGTTDYRGNTKIYQHGTAQFPGIIDNETTLGNLAVGDHIWMYLADGTLVAKLELVFANGWLFRSGGDDADNILGKGSSLGYNAGIYFYPDGLKDAVEHVGGTYPAGLTTASAWTLYDDDNGLGGGEVGWYLRTQPNGDWTQLEADIDGEAAEDFSGHSVSLSSDGSKVAIGAIYNDGNGSNAGHVRVYQLVPPTITTTSTAVFSNISTNVYNPTELKLESSGNIFVCERGINKITKILFDGINYNSKISILEGLNEPVSFDFDSDNNLFVINKGDGTIRKAIPPQNNSNLYTLDSIYSGIVNNLSSSDNTSITRRYYDETDTSLVINFTYQFTNQSSIIIENNSTMISEYNVIKIKSERTVASYKEGLFFINENSNTINRYQEYNDSNYSNLIDKSTFVSAGSNILTNAGKMKFSNSHELLILDNNHLKKISMNIDSYQFN